jgi:hypothetical protein
MNDIKLITMKITNFKGIDNRELNFDGVNMNIYGRNFIGKTSIYDAFCWILFDKDSSGNKNFDIKPLDGDNKVKYPGADTTVCVELAVNGEIVSLKKTYHEVWTQQRGSVDKTFSGHTSEYYIDEIPTKKTDFDKYINELSDESTFKMLTNVYMFCVDTQWQERRKILFDMCGIADDVTLMAQDNRFDDLIPNVHKHTIDDYKSSLTAQRKSLVTEKNKVPESISAYTEVKNDALQIDYAGIESDKSTLEDTAKELTTKIVEIKNDTAISTLTNQYNSLVNDIRELESDNTAYRNTQSKVDDSEYFTQKNNFNLQLGNIKYEQETIADQVKFALKKAERLQDECSRIREEYNKPDDGNDEMCPTCKRLYEGATLDEIQANKKKHRMELREQGIKIKGDIEATNRRVVDLNQKVSELSKQYESVNKQLSSLKAPEAPVVTDMDNYTADKQALQTKQTDIKNQIDKLKIESNTVLIELQSELTKTNNEIKSLNEKLSQRSVVTDMERRIEKLIVRERELASQIEDIDRRIYLCEEFTKYKVSFVEDSINSRFKIIKFKLFEEQINGGIKDCCEVLYNGVPFGTNASRSEQINAALDVIQTLSDFYDIRVPLFVDNAECVTELYDIDTQVIRLVVSENDYELRCESYVTENKEKTANSNPAA